MILAVEVFQQILYFDFLFSIIEPSFPGNRRFYATDRKSDTSAIPAVFLGDRPWERKRNTAARSGPGG